MDDPMMNSGNEVEPMEEKAEMTGGESANTIFLSADAYPDNKDGDRVSTTVEGILMEHDGKRMLMVEMADGKPVSPFEDMDEEGMSDKQLGSEIAKMGKQVGGMQGYR